jgi:hypothetical protein
VHHEYAPLGQTGNKEYYQVLRHLHDAVQRKRPELHARNWQLHHDNAPAHSSHLIQGFLAKNGIPQVRQAPCDFLLFPRLKTLLKGSRFDGRKDLIQNVMAQLHTIPKQVFQKCYQQNFVFPALDRILFEQASYASLPCLYFLQCLKYWVTDVNIYIFHV